MRAFPREVTRIEACIGLPPDICGISATVTGPSHSPARFFMVVKDFCASDGTGATEDFGASDCAKATTVASDIKTADSIEPSDFIFFSLTFFNYLLIWVFRWRTQLRATSCID